MEVKQSEMTQEIWDDWSALIRGQECAVCGNQLTIRTIPERASMVIGCPNPEHSGFRQRTSYTEEYRRGREVYPTMRDNIEAKMLVKSELNRAMNLLAMRFPEAIKDIAGASLFVNDCMRLGLDPLIQPSEAVPIPFKTKDKDGREKITVAMIVTEDGALSMAARGCPDEYGGAPATMPLMDYLMREHPQRTYEDLLPVAQRTAEELCGDPEAYVWVALGKRRSATEINPVYGYYTRAERKKAQDRHLPAGSQPGNQARVRAVKRWVRENFPESRQKMLEYSSALVQRTGGIPELQDFIDAEYTTITGPLDKNTPLISPPTGGQKSGAKTARSTKAKKHGNEICETAQLNTEQHDEEQKEPSGADEDISLPSSDSVEMAKKREACAAGEGFSIPMDWLNNTLKILKWSEETTLSWLSSNFKIDATGKKLLDIIPTLTRQQAERFTRELQERSEKIQPELFK